MDIYGEICSLMRQRRRSALATIVNSGGSIPSSTAAKMLVRDDGSVLGTIGGGCVEHEVTRAAIEVIKDEKPRTFTFNLDQHPDDDAGLICGGSLQVFVEPLIPAPLLYIFGAGHIGVNVYKMALTAGFEIAVVDDREAYANRERFPDALDVRAGTMDRILSEIDPPEDSYVVIVTRGHRHDMRVLRWAIETKARYIGMVGSVRKVLTIYEQLENEGVSRDSLDRVYAPIGLQLGAVTPEEIAVSVVAELIAVRRRCKIPQSHGRNKLTAKLMPHK